MHRPAERKVTRLCVDTSYAEALEATKRAPAPTKRMREEAAQACAGGVCAAPAREPAKWSPFPLLAGLFVLVVVVLLLSPGCVPMEAVEQCKDQAANAYGFSQRAPSQDGREIGAVFLEAWRRQHMALVGEDVPQALEEGWPPLGDLAPVSSR